MKTILGILSLICVLPSRADNIVVYKQDVLVTKTGAGAITKTKRTGWAVFDETWHSLAFVLLDTQRRTFTVEEESYDINNLPVGGGQYYTMIYIQSGQFFQMFAKETLI